MARNGINWPKKWFKLAEMARNGKKWHELAKKIG